jgi:hypothetical protein
MPKPSCGAWISTSGLAASTVASPAMWSEWRCDSTTESTVARSTPLAATLRANTPASLPVSNRMRRPSTSMSAANPQSFSIEASSPKAS